MLGFKGFIQDGAARTIPSVLRRRFEGFFSAASIALSRARLRPMRRGCISLYLEQQG